MKKKGIRLLSAVILGTIFGVVCWLLTRAAPEQEGFVLNLAMILGIILNRTMIGFSIGISNLKGMNYLLHGIVMGLIVSLLMSIFPLANGDIMGFIMIEFAGAIYGLLIELIVTKFLKSPIQ